MYYYTMPSIADLGESGVVDVIMFGVAVTAVIALCSSLVRKAFTDKYAGVNLPPGNLGLPLLGNALEMAKGVVRFADERPPISSMSLLGTRAVLVKDAKMAEKVVRGEGRLVEQNFARNPALEKMTGPQSLTTLQGDKHRRMRAMIMPAFSKVTLEHAFKMQQKIMHTHLSRWTEGCSFDASAASNNLAADFGCAFIGIKVLSGDKAGERVITLIDDLMRGMAALPINIPGIDTVYRKAELAREELYASVIRPVLRDRLENTLPSDAGQRDFVTVLRNAQDEQGNHITSVALCTFTCTSVIRPILKDRRENPLPSDAGQRDFVTVLLNARDEQGNPMDDQALEDNMVGAIFASIDTTFSAFLHFLIGVCKHQDVQKKIHDEIRAVLGDQFRGGDSMPTSALDELEYLPRVFKELSRMHSVAPFLFFRKAKMDFELGGYTIPKGMYVQLSSPHIQNDPNVWTNPEKFDPSRWEPCGEGTRNNRLLLDFGFGSRLCMGKKLAEREKLLFAALLLRDHKIEFVSGKEPTMGAYLPLQRIDGEFLVKITRIE